MAETDLGVLLLRLVLAGLLTGHALQKSLGWFRGQGLEGTAETFELWGFRPGRPHVQLAAVAELAGAASIALGLLTPLGCAIVMGTMVVAAAPTASNGLWAHLGGCEVPVAYAAMALVLAVTGPGAVSLDAALGVPGLGYLDALGAVVIAAAAALPPLARRRRTLQQLTV